MKKIRIEIKLIRLLILKIKHRNVFSEGEVKWAFL